MLHTIKKYLPKHFLLLAFFLLPALAFAAAPSTFRDFADILVAAVKGIINILFVSLSVGLAYGVALYFINSDNEQKRAEIKGYLLWGVIGITVVFGLWGIVQILCDTLSWCTVGVPYIQAPA
jgi:uncharacterized membrane-anchored protein